MQDNNEYQLNSQPLSISFSTSKSNDQHYRGISISNSTSSPSQHNNIHKPIEFIQPQSKALFQNQNHQKIGMDNTINKPINFLKTPITIQEHSNNYENSGSCDSPLNITIPSLVSNTFNYNNYTNYANKLNSFVVPNTDCKTVLNNINNILHLQFNDNIEHKINYNTNNISGLVFLSSYHLYFNILVYCENDNNNNIIFEFNRVSGNSVASAKFWSIIKRYYTQIMNGKKLEKDMNNQFDFIEFDLNSKLPPIENFNEQMDLNVNSNRYEGLIESLVRNDIFVLDELNFLYDSLVENKQIGINILNNKNLMQLLVNKSMINNNICVSRIALLILNELCKSDCNINGILNEQNGYKLFTNINLLLEHKTDLIKKYSIKLLNNLLLIGNGLGMNENEKKRMVESVKKYENVCTNKNYYEMIQIIYQKLNY